MAQPPKTTPAAPRAQAKPAPAKPAAAKPTPATNAIAVAEPEAPVGKLSWILGWIVAPLSVLGAIYGGGVLLGAHRPEGWFARSVMWVANLF
jgi:hypothetical protein